MNHNDYAEALIKRFVRDITDYVFLSIQNDDELMREYHTNVNRHGLQDVNMAIGKKIETLLNLENDEGRNDKPKSKLIKSYTYHKLK